VNTLTGVSAPVGTLLGPGRGGRIFVVIGEVEEGVQVDYATPEQVREAIQRAFTEPQSMTEIAMVRQRRAMIARTEAAQRVQDGIEAMARRLALSRPGPSLRRHRKHKIGGGR
jgi:hypothetical protein